MNKSEIIEFKKFLSEKNCYMMFSEFYRKNHLSVNPQGLDRYFETARAESVIPQAFVYPKSLYDKDFWLAIHEEWLERLRSWRNGIREAEQLDRLELEIIDICTKPVCTGLPKGTCSLSLRGGNRLTLNVEDSKKIARKLSTHMLLTRSRKTTDVVLMFNRQRGIEVKFRPNSNTLLFNNAELTRHLVDLLDLDPKEEYFQLKMELMAETGEYLMYVLKKNWK